MGAILRKCRVHCRLSQHEVAATLGVSQSTYSAWESDKCTPKSSYLPALAATLRTSVPELLSAGKPALIGAGESLLTPASALYLTTLQEKEQLEQEIHQLRAQVLWLTMYVEIMRTLSTLL
ncbi:helix-turn-helix domain-containing protein [Hymenobacter translucens]|uniref:helix-turn-helix domain-containing protein n=1 Tax=Hymenobacter translucens TaxID=2886507 RepID=UPI001D0E25DF|nr:helix-turn-helix transcriptional regulator [Hymenobacter translucens]